MLLSKNLVKSKTCLIFNSQTEKLNNLTSESLQYQAIIQVLLSKLSWVKQEISDTDLLILEQSKLIQNYKQVNEISRKNSNKIFRGVIKAANEARKVEHQIFTDFTVQHARNEQLAKENEILHQIIQTNIEWCKILPPQNTISLDKPSFNHLMKAKSTESKIDYGEFNPFKRNFKMTKMSEVSPTPESQERSIINMALA